MSYVQNTPENRASMLDTLGLKSVEDLFTEIPRAVRNPRIRLPQPLTEAQLVREMRALSERNADLDHFPSFLGAGSYRHFIPSAVRHLLSRTEFYSPYTPYQPEISQGILQSMFEYQSMVSNLTAMDVANSSMYDGASALAEAVLMACHLTGRRAIAVSSTMHPEYVEVVKTYAAAQGMRVDLFSPDAPQVADDVSSIAAQQPNFFGNLEDMDKIGELAHSKGALFVANIDPISLGILKPPGEYGADIVVGEGQPLGTPVSFGGPYLGIFACRSHLMRQMPGRVVGQTVDKEGRRGFVLTLQTREQHIRRERATSNVCSNETLIALGAAIYLGLMGKSGIKRVAELCYHKAHYAAAMISKTPGYCLAFDKPFFKEFVVNCPIPPRDLEKRLLEKGIIGGLDVSDLVPDGMLFCVTELNTREEIDSLVAVLGATS